MAGRLSSVKVSTREHLCRLPHTSALTSIGEQGDQGCRQAINVALINKQARLLMFDDVRDPTHTRRHNWKAARQSFHHTIGSALVMAGQTKEPGLAHQIRNRWQG